MLKRLGSAAVRSAAAAAQQQQRAGAAGAGANAFASTAGGASSSGSAGGAAAAPAAAGAASKLPPRIKAPEQLTPEELEKALPSMFFTTSNLVWSTLVASGVAAAGLVSMVWLGTWIVTAADRMRAPSAAAAAAAPAAPPPEPKTLAQLIEERRAELESELQQLQQLPRTPEVKQRLSEVNNELRTYRPSGGSWWRLW